MQTIKTILFLLTITLQTHANIPPLTTYNENNQPLVIEYEDGSTILYEYDGEGKLLSVVNDYANKAQKFIYDSYDRLVRIELADGSTTTYAYTPSGRVKSITDAQGTIDNTYDSMGRLKSQTAPSGDTISYDYDGVGNIVKIQTPQTTITKTYDALNRLKTVTDAQGTVTYDYDAIGRQTQVTYANGITTNYEYDSRNRITSIEHKKSDGTVLQSFTYTLDAVGNRTKIVESNGRTVDYTYNTVHQLTQEVVSNDPSGNNTTTTFTYDAVGNMLTKTIDGVQTGYAYNANDQLTTQGSVTFTYDDNGNLVQKDSTTYEYDDKNRLIKVTTPNNTIEYSYDANDNRVAKTTNDGTTTYLIDANTAYAQVITESKEDGTEVNYTYGNDLLSDGTHSFLTDALGSTRGLVDSSEALTDEYAYTPYGELANHMGSSENDFLYTGEQLDPETEDYYLRARYYSPHSGRFLSRDTYAGTSRDPITLNHYLYTGSNPVMYVDPSGNFFGLASMMSSMNILSSLRGASFGFASRAVGVAGVRNLLMRLTVRTLQPIFRAAGRIALKQSRGKKLTQFTKFKRFFISPNKTHPPVSPYFKNMMKRIFPKTKWEQHHVGIQQKWFRQGGPNQWYPYDKLANEGLRRLGNAGFNLMAIPRGLNAALGRSGLGTAGFAVGSYGTVAWAVYEIISTIGGEE